MRILLFVSGLAWRRSGLIGLLAELHGSGGFDADCSGGTFDLCCESSGSSTVGKLQISCVPPGAGRLVEDCGGGISDLGCESSGSSTVGMLQISCVPPGPGRFVEECGGGTFRKRGEKIQPGNVGSFLSLGEDCGGGTFDSFFEDSNLARLDLLKESPGGSGGLLEDCSGVASGVRCERIRLDRRGNTSISYSAETEVERLLGFLKKSRSSCGVVGDCERQIAR